MAVPPASSQASTGTQSQILLFGDLSLIQFKDQLRHLLHVKNNPLLTSLFDRVNYSLRRFIEVLPEEEQDLFPRFTTLIDLIHRFGDTEGTSALGFFLLSVHEVAQCIVYVLGNLSSPFSLRQISMRFIDKLQSCNGERG